MPKIPQYTSQKNIQQPDSIQAENIQVRQLSTEAPAIRIDAASYAHEARAMSQLGVTIGNIAQDIYKVKSDQAFAKGKIQFYQGLKQIEKEGAEDTNIGEDFEVRYSKKIKDLQENIAKTIRYPQAKQAFQQDAELKATYSFYDITSDARRRMLAFDKNLMKQEIETTTDRYITATTDGEKQNAKDELAKIFSERVNSKLLGKKEALLLHQEAVKGLGEKQAEYNVINDTSIETKNSYTFQQLELGEKGIYKNLSPFKREELKKKSRLKINDNKQYAKEIQIDDRLKILMDFANGKIDYANSDNLINQLSIKDPELGEAIKKGTDTLFIPEIKDEAFAEVTKKVFSASTKEEISTYLMNVLNENGNKEIGKERLAILINAATERANGLKTTSESQPITPNQKQIEIDSSINSLLNILNPALSIPNLIVNFFKGISTGNSIKESHDNAIKSEINRVNPISVKYKIGDIITNPKTGQSAEVIGLNDNGAPIVKRRVSGK